MIISCKLPRLALAVTLVGLLSVQSASLEVGPLSPSQINGFTPYTHFAGTAYCQPRITLSWSCGANCEANSDFTPVASGGDGSDVQFWYVGYSPSLASVIVAHQGTDVSKIQAVATDVDIVQERLDSTLFPEVPSSVQVHSGFAKEQAKTARQVLSAVEKAVSAHGAKKVTVVGHSLGAAIALLDGVYLPPRLPGVTVTVIGFGMPRVGNQEFANYVDSHLRLTHINNKKDPVPIVPGRALGYHHPSGEVHITESGSWESCPGHDNPSKLCTVGDVPNLFVSDASDHSGPYNGIIMGC